MCRPKNDKLSSGPAKRVLQSILVFSVCGIAEQKVNTGQEKSGL